MSAVGGLKRVLVLLLVVAALGSGLPSASHCGTSGSHSMGSMHHHHDAPPAPHSTDCDHCPPAQCASVPACGGMAQRVEEAGFNRAVIRSNHSWYEFTASWIPSPFHEPPFRPPVRS